MGHGLPLLYHGDSNVLKGNINGFDIVQCEYLTRPQASSNIYILWILRKDTAADETGE